MTVRNQVILYLEQKLAAVPNATVFPSREEALSRDEGTGIVVREDEEEPENRAGGGPQGLVLRNFTALISVLARAPGVPAPAGPTAGAVADPVIEAAHAIVMADTTLGGLCSTIIEGPTKWDYEEADGTAVAVDMRFTVRYQTRANSLSNPD